MAKQQLHQSEQGLVGGIEEFFILGPANKVLEHRMHPVFNKVFTSRKMWFNPLHKGIKTVDKPGSNIGIVAVVVRNKIPLQYERHNRLFWKQHETSTDGNASP